MKVFISIALVAGGIVGAAQAAVNTLFAASVLDIHEVARLASLARVLGGAFLTIICALQDAIARFNEIGVCRAVDARRLGWQGWIFSSCANRTSGFARARAAPDNARAYTRFCKRSKLSRLIALDAILGKEIKGGRAGSAGCCVGAGVAV